jgi:hypothetical protein
MPAIAMPSISTKGSPSMIMRSAKVPLSPSSALQTMYLLLGPAAFSTVFHLMPVGKPAPPRPAQAAVGDRLDDIGGRHRHRLLQAGKTAIHAVVVERQRIDDAAAREGEAGLLGRNGIFLRSAQTERMVAAGQKAGVEQTRLTSDGFHRAVGDAALVRPLRPSARASA